MMAKIRSIQRAGTFCSAMWEDDKGVITVCSFPSTWDDKRIRAYINGEKTVEKENTVETIPKTEGITPPNEGIRESDLKERRKALIISMKKQLAGTGVDCATLKLEQLKPLYVKTFGEKALACVEKEYGMDGSI